MRARIGWLLFVATAGCAVAEVYLIGSRRPLLSQGTYLAGWPVISFAAVGGAFMAALIISRYPRHRVGWLLSVGELGTAVGLCADAFGVWATGGDPSWSAAGQLGTWVGALFGTPYGVALVTALFLLVPDGRLPSRRWRVVVWVAALGLVLHVAALAGLGPAGLVAGDRSSVPPWIVAVDTAANVVLLGGLVAAAVALARRTRAARGVQRQQLRWIAASAVALAAGLLIGVVGLTVTELLSGTFQAVGAVPPIVVTPLFLGYAAVPVCTGIAVLRYRLYDIDVVINRAVVVAAATVLVTGLYVGAVLVLGGLLGPTASGFRRSLVATTIAALAFQPLRRRVTTLANRLAYGRRAVPYEALVDFSNRATASPKPQALLESVAVAVGRAVAARSVTAALTLSGSEPLTAQWPAQPPTAAGAPGPAHLVETRLDVVDDVGELGWVSVRMPPGRQLTAAERRLLRDLADQAAVGFRNARLEAELAGHLATLARRTEELERSRRRIIQAQDHERIRLERAIHHSVLPNLTVLPTELAATAAAVRGDDVAPDLEPLLARTAEALAALREIGHGLRTSPDVSPDPEPTGTGSPVGDRET